MNNTNENKLLDHTTEFEQKALIQFQKLWHFLKQHPTLTISLIYMLVSYMGLYYVYMLLRRFEVDILSHLEVTDLILAILHHPVIFVVCALFFAFFWCVLKCDQVMRRYAWYRRANDTINKPVLGFNPLVVYVVCIVFLLHIVIDFSADVVENDIRHGEQQQFKLILSNEVLLNGQKTKQLDKVQVIADSSKYLWIYMLDIEQVLAIPPKNIGTLAPVISQPEGKGTVPNKSGE